jgi:hypothetical protein
MSFSNIGANCIFKCFRTIQISVPGQQTKWSTNRETVHLA